MLQTADGTDVALLNTQTSKALQELEQRNIVRHSVYVTAAEWAEKITLFKTKGKSVCLEADIYFFGSMSNSTCVGTILSNNGLFLQRLDFLDSTTRYENPQEINFPSLQSFRPPLSVPTLEQSSISDLSVDMVNTVLGDLAQTGNLRCLDVDTTAITTELKQ